MLGEGDWDGLWQMRCVSAETILIGLPLDDVDLVVGSDVLVRALHDDDITASDGPHDTGGLLLDAVLALESVVPVVIAGASSRGIVNTGMKNRMVKSFQFEDHFFIVSNYKHIRLKILAPTCD